MTSAATDRASLAPYPTYPLQHILSETARRLPQKAAIIDGEYVYSYQQLDAYSNRFAAALAKLGVVKGDRVGLLAPNCAEFEIAFFGIVKAGAVVT
ncbi:MAG: AMP-binding protein, partial [Chloroflexi bacterium]|nr:AMP-binding protein [Chloroflexota bacterium]